MTEEATSPEERRAELAALRALGTLDGVSLEQLAESLGCPVGEIEHA